MKNYCIFAASQTKRFIHNIDSCGFFYGCTSGICKRYGAVQFPVDCCTSVFVISLGRDGKRAALSASNDTIIFHYTMTKRNENCSTANNSTCTVTPASATTATPPRYVVSEETSKYLDCLAALDKVFSLYFEAVEFQYCEKVADETINKIFYDKFKALRNDIESSMTECIYDQMSCVGNNSI